VDRYLSDELLPAVAREAASGRLLLVATTNVDTGESVVWDLGSIAMNGGANAKALFRQVLVASASVPGMFPPVIMRIQDDAGEYNEAHIDGSATIPFLVPSALLQPPQDAPPRSPPTVYVIVDGRLSEERRSTPLRLRTIVSRSIAAGMTHMVRTTLELTATTAERQGAELQYSAIPMAYPHLDAFDFRASAMRPLFQYGYDCANAGRLWSALRRIATEPAGGGDTSRAMVCPADDDLIGRVAAR